MACQGSNGTGGAATYRCGRARLLRHCSPVAPLTTGAARFFQLPPSSFDVVATPLLLASATRPSSFRRWRLLAHVTSVTAFTARIGTTFAWFPQPDLGTTTYIDFYW